jgi:5-methylcytosine-specific restriction endonuclease McrA
MIEVVNDDDAYLRWLEANPDGFVLNAEASPRAAYLRLHRSRCNDISSANRTNWTTTSYLKVCSNLLNELEAWARDATGGVMVPCQHCQPEYQPTLYRCNAESQPPGPSESDFDGLPFSQYPGQGRVLLGRRSGEACRHGYGLTLQTLTAISRCGYCGLDFTSSYQHWLLMQVDHAVPVKMGKRLRIPMNWLDDYANCVLACSACNTFDNQYDDFSVVAGPDSLNSFFDLRDRIFHARKPRILRCHQAEKEFFESTPWAEL